MPADADAIRDRLTELGWVVRSVVAPALTVGDRDMGVITAQIERGPLRAWFVVLLASEDGDLADRYMSPARASIATVSRRFPDRGWKIRAEVHDRERARTELACLRAFLQRPPEETSFAQALAVFEERGWQIDRGRSEETFFDEPSWSIRGSRGTDLLDLGVVWSGRGTDDAAIDIDQMTFVSVRTRHYFATATVTSRAPAEALVLAY